MRRQQRVVHSAVFVKCKRFQLEPFSPIGDVALGGEPVRAAGQAGA